MFGVGGGEMLVIALVALIAVGPEQLPSVMRKIGGYLGQVKAMADGARAEFMSGVDELDPTNWMGDGSDDKPIVPRGFAENATKSTLETPLEVEPPPGDDPGADDAPQLDQRDSDTADASVTVDEVADGDTVTVADMAEEIARSEAAATEAAATEAAATETETDRSDHPAA